MEIDSMYLLNTNPLLKIPIFEEQKDVWVNEIFEGRETNGEFHTLFLQLLEQLCKFYDYFRMLPETFWYILNDIRDGIKKQSNFRNCISSEERLAVTLR
jgi:hypothetical protein